MALTLALLVAVGLIVCRPGGTRRSGAVRWELVGDASVGSWIAGFRRSVRQQVSVWVWAGIEGNLRKVWCSYVDRRFCNHMVANVVYSIGFGVYLWCVAHQMVLRRQSGNWPCRVKKKATLAAVDFICSFFRRRSVANQLGWAREGLRDIGGTRPCGLH